MPKDHFDEQVASRYDIDSAELFDPGIVDPTVAFLADLAAGGSALELGIGTGRIALPLGERGVPVDGIDLSEEMVKRLREKQGGSDLEVTIGDFATTRLGKEFRLVFLVYNGISNLTTQDEQVECFRNASWHLEPGGYFVIEVLVPALRLLPPGQTFRPFTVTPTRLGFDEYDTVTQAAVSHHYSISDDKVDVWSTPWRYVWPSELDLMARLAGMTLQERWGGWNREPFTAKSHSHVSVWTKDE